MKYRSWGDGLAVMTICLGSVSKPTWIFANIWNSSSRGSNQHLTPVGIRHVCGANAFIQAKHTCTLNKSFKKSPKDCDSTYIEKRNLKHVLKSSKHIRGMITMCTLNYSRNPHPRRQAAADLQNHSSVQALLSRVKQLPFFPWEVYSHILKWYLKSTVSVWREVTIMEALQNTGIPICGRQPQWSLTPTTGVVYTLFQADLTD